MMLVVHEQEFIARPGIREAHAAWVAGGAPVGDPAHGTLRGKLRIGEGEQRGEARGRQAGNSEVHDWLPMLAHAQYGEPAISNHPIPVARMERRATPRNPGRVSRI